LKKHRKFVDKNEMVWLVNLLDTINRELDEIACRTVMNIYEGKVMDPDEDRILLDLKTKKMAVEYMIDSYLIRERDFRSLH